MNAAVNQQMASAATTQDALQLIQLELKAPKSKWNKFGNFHYRSLEDILEGVKPLLKKYGATLVVSDEVQQVGPVVVITAKAVFTDAEGKQTVISAHAGVDINKKGMDVAQTFGASSSYARKYALNGLFLIDDTQDPDTDAFHEQNNTQARNNQQNAPAQNQQRSQNQPAQQQPKPQQQNQTVQPNAAQQLTHDFQQALNSIHHTQNEDDLGVIYRQFKGTRYENQIVQACKAKKDMEGWSA
ncbi:MULTISPECIES: ERF family protein [unclassified Acinetobacter]|uniref:ERF family protein n=1 Tax=unclassified Acinetobacter TaxID=196816 RepID=UPI00244C0814|nr:MULTISPECIES: ERF family protein [unclassified Acinetobacter]MDH0031368.1 ERF family protein [Acinetobacter sp. GD04021]MDH0887147.1 ERF family protein [Acinetobacter sp. GD03873]MDH1083564.1 ERF family protein [Acinetobacter sp. GD03983]MDH2190463.1 ERF family protein [Acinetobacter sp. GD03645]MDH2204091.1 ERF family protein [Acinetobacter sp. GD03647]